MYRINKVEPGIGLTFNKLISLDLKNLWLHDRANLDRTTLLAISSLCDEERGALLDNSFVPQSFATLLIKLAYVKRYPAVLAKIKSQPDAVIPAIDKELLPGIFYNIDTGGRKWLVYITKESLWWEEALKLAKSMIGNDYDPEYVRLAFKSTGPYLLPTSARDLSRERGIIGWSAFDRIEPAVFDRLNTPMEEDLPYSYPFPRALFMSIPIDSMQLLAIDDDNNEITVKFSAELDPEYPFVSGQNQPAVMVFIETSPNILELGSSDLIKATNHPLQANPTKYLHELFYDFPYFRQQLREGKSTVWSLLLEQIWHMSLHEARQGVFWGVNRYELNLQNNTPLAGNTDPDDSRVEDLSTVKQNKSRFPQIFMAKLDLLIMLYSLDSQDNIINQLIDLVKNLDIRLQISLISLLLQSDYFTHKDSIIAMTVPDILNYLYRNDTDLDEATTIDLLAMLRGMQINSWQQDNSVLHRVIDIGKFQMLAFGDLIDCISKVRSTERASLLQRAEKLIKSMDWGFDTHTKKGYLAVIDELVLDLKVRELT